MRHWGEIEGAAAAYLGRSEAELAALLGDTIRELADLHRLRGCKGDIRQVEYRQIALQHRVALDFGDRYGWRLSLSDFDLITLGRGKRHSGGRRYDPVARGAYDHRCLDHPYYYRRDGKAAAIAAHLYDWPSVRPDCEALAARFGLTLLTPDFPSWWYPGVTTLCVYAGPAGAGSEIRAAGRATPAEGENL